MWREARLLTSAFAADTSTGSVQVTRIHADFSFTIRDRENQRHRARRVNPRLRFFFSRYKR